MDMFEGICADAYGEGQLTRGCGADRGDAHDERTPWKRGVIGAVAAVATLGVLGLSPAGLEISTAIDRRRSKPRLGARAVVRFIAAAS